MCPNASVGPSVDAKVRVEVEGRQGLTALLLYETSGSEKNTVQVYVQAVITSLEEVENALVACNKTQVRSPGERGV